MLSSQRAADPSPTSDSTGGSAVIKNTTRPSTMTPPSMRPNAKPRNVHGLRVSSSS